MATPYELPNLHSRAFNCPYCGAYAHQRFFDLGPTREWQCDPSEPVDREVESIVANECIAISICFHCDKAALWRHDGLLYPVIAPTARPVEDMPKDVREDFEEARQVLFTSPRSACALLRLALQKLLVHLGETGENINSDIGRLVRKGLPIRLQQAMDVVRVVGNEAVHPGVLDLRDNVDMAQRLFLLINLVVDVMVTKPSEAEMLFDGLPEDKKAQVAKRDRT